jgi:branched-chain amino acid transport system ATP-binding protein
MSEDGLHIRQLQAGYGTLRAVDGIDIDVAPGEIVSLIGRNGAGKTTALLAAAGLRFGRNSGEVILNGEDLSRAGPADVVSAGLAHVPDGHRVFRSMTVRENLVIGAYCHRKAGRQALDAGYDRVVELFPILKTYAAKPAGFLSGGEQQMVAIGQALMAGPNILMLDEPTSGLALVVIKVIIQALNTLKESGVGILLVEQSVGRALDVADHAYVMESGRIALSGPTAVLREDSRVGVIVRGMTPEDENASGGAPAGDDQDDLDRAEAGQSPSGQPGHG